MKYTKRIPVGNFLKKGEDFKENDILIIKDAGKQIEGNYGTQDVFTVQTPAGKEGLVAFNTTTINCLIDAYGEESEGWVGKPIKAWGIISNVQGKMLKVYYFVHPQTKIDEQGNFYMSPNEAQTPASNQSSVPAKEGDPDYVSADQIPF